MPLPQNHWRRHAPVRALERCAVVGVILGRLERLHKADALEDRTSRPARTLFGAVEQAELERVHPQAQLIDRRFHRKGRECQAR